MSQPFIMDEEALLKKRMRVLTLLQKGAQKEANFLLSYVAEDFLLRLSTITKNFGIGIVAGSLDESVYNSLLKSEKIDTVYQSKSVPFCLEANTDWVEKDGTLSLGPMSVDFFVSALTMQFINDLPGFLVQARRALRPDGLFLGALIGGESLRELRQSFLEAEVHLTGNAHNRILPFIDVRDAGGLLQRAGFTLPVSDVDRLTVRYDTAFNLMRDLRAMGASNILHGREQRFARKEVFLKMAEIYQEKFSDKDGRIRATFDIISLCGWAAHESQQKPLKPGSGQVSLADALNAR